MPSGKKKRTHKTSNGVHGGGGKVTWENERQRPASIEGGIVARFKPIGTVNHYTTTKENS